MHRRILVLAVLACVTTAAQAHPGHGGTGFLSGLLHPMQGLDHLLAMLAVGLWAALRDPDAGPQRVWLLPALFVSGAALGTALGLAGVFNGTVEIAVAASLLPLGLALLFGTSARHQIALCLVPICGVLHGGAHGTELAGLAGAGTIAGFLLGTALLHLAGVGIALALPASRRRMLVAGCGGGLAAASVWLLA
jgi:urease accessory protein